MTCIHFLQISLNRILLLTVGLWPYQQSKVAQFQLNLFIGIITSFVVFQFTVFVTSKCTPDLLINILSSALFYTTVAIKYILFSVNIENIKYLLEQTQHIYIELTDKNEINIIEKYSSYAKRYTVVFSLFAMFIIIAIILYSFWPHISLILFSINGTVSRPLLPVMTEYFIDQEKYFYFILFHTNASLIITSITMLATGTILIVYQKHACGMFRIASYRIKQAMTFEILQKNSLANENLIYTELIYAVDMHRKAMKLSDSIISRFKVTISFLIIFGVITTSLNFFRIFQQISFGYNAVELLLRLVIIITLFSYVFVGNYLAQEITDHNNDIFITVYNVQWYIAPLQIQKMILFLLQRGTKAFSMNIDGLFVGSLEGAASLLSTIISYFTVLHSTQNK